MSITNKKIWLVNHYAVSPDTGGGTRHFDIARELVKRGHDIAIFASSFDHKLRSESLGKGVNCKKETVDGVQFFWLRTFPYQNNDFRRVINMVSFAIRMFCYGCFMKKPDIIIASSPHPLAWFTGYLLSLVKRTRFMAEVRDLWPQSAIDMGEIRENSFTAKALQRLEKYIYNRAGRIIVLMPAAQNYLASLGIRPDKVVYIPNGVDIKTISVMPKDQTPQIESIVRRHQGQFNNIYIGAHGHANALDTILQAAQIIQEKKEYQDISFILVGDGPEKNRLRELSEQLKLKNVFFYNPIKKVLIPQLLNNMDICLFTLLKSDVFQYGISPNKLFDYLSAAKPVIFACESQNDIIKETGAGISIPPQDPAALAQAVIKLYRTSVAERVEMGEKGRRYVEEFHDISQLAEKLESIL